jgi:hypothetical protein
MEQLVIVLAIVTALEPAAVEQQGLQRAVTNQYKLDELSAELIRRHTTESQRKFVGNAAVVTRVIVERKVTLEYQF